MITVFSTDHLLRSPRTELYGGELVRPHESPQRAQIVLERIQSQRIGQVIAPASFDAAPLLRVHDHEYIEFLKQAWNEWVAAGNRGEAIPDCWPARRMMQRRPNSITGKLGYYAMAGETSISHGTWEAARAAADVALTGASQIKEGAARVAILDVDFHHGNGTQDIFYDRPDVLYISLHGDPAEAFPYFSGFADETGTGAGAGFTLNLPLPPGTEFGAWRDALRAALMRIENFRADALVVSLGVDTFAEDPISFFRLQSADFSTYGRMIGGCALPTLFVLEGGYAVGEIGVNVVNVLTGFEDEQAR
jgi:acetoin utilization deacetylase AcuC-like enzyme